MQLLHDHDEHISHLQAECEDMRQDHKETSITASDMDGEVNRLKKVSWKMFLCLNESSLNGDGEVLQENFLLPEYTPDSFVCVAHNVCII